MKRRAGVLAGGAVRGVHGMTSRLAWAAVALGVVLMAVPARAGCRDVHVAGTRLSAVAARIIPEAHAAGAVTLEWFGHSFFGLTSSRGTAVFTDPFGPMGFPLPEVTGHVVTVGREHGNHNNVGLVQGNPQIFRGLSPDGLGWNKVLAQVRDVRVFNVPVWQKGPTFQMRGAAFAFEMDDLCIVHLGDLAHELSDEMVEAFGKVDVLLVPIGGIYTADPLTAVKVVQQVKPRVAIPMHYWYNLGTLGIFTQAFASVRHWEERRVLLYKEALPPPTEIWVLGHPR